MASAYQKEELLPQYGWYWEGRRTNSEGEDLQAVWDGFVNTRGNATRNAVLQPDALVGDGKKVKCPTKRKKFTKCNSVREVLSFK